MVVEGPEVLHCVECDDGALVVAPAAVSVVSKEPKRPRVLKLATRGKKKIVIRGGYH